MNNYRIPTIDELLTEGFEYELRVHKKGDKLGSFEIFDPVNKNTFYREDSFAEEDKWTKQVKENVDGKPWEIKDSDSGITYKGTYLDFYDNPYQQKEFLERQLELGNIRCKIK